ncbi:uncharacterized protein LOC127806326 [Diospyros lotus]|uniref:uncharacterized protein LOC127806326 n=1 Tax=Diospyros lotus TaxID=55363 RepID=UPI00224D8C5F|nr:uncharacterized protein LOC127806326 [Diospyros lotus]
MAASSIKAGGNSMAGVQELVEADQGDQWHRRLQPTMAETSWRRKLQGRPWQFSEQGHGQQHRCCAWEAGGDVGSRRRQGVLAGVAACGEAGLGSDWDGWFVRRGFSECSIETIPEEKTSRGSKNSEALIDHIIKKEGNLLVFDKSENQAVTTISLRTGNAWLLLKVNGVLYVRNLSFDITSEDTRGTAFVVYEDIYDAKTAVDHLSGFNVANRYLIVLYYQHAKMSKKFDHKKKEDKITRLQKKYDLSTKDK